MKAARRAGTWRAAEDFRCLADGESAPVPARKPHDLRLAGGGRDNPALADVAARAGNGILPDESKEVAPSAIPRLPRVGKQALVPLPGNGIRQPRAEQFLIVGEKEDRTGGLAVPAGAPRFLQVGFHGRGYVGMDDGADIRLVHSQPICAGGNERPVTGIEEPLLQPGPLLPGQPAW